jgi:hypothetical protein
MIAIQIKQILDKMLINHSKNLLNKSNNLKRKKIKKAVNNHIQFTDLRTILFYLGFTEKEFSK